MILVHGITTSPANSTPIWFPSYLFLYFLFIFYLPCEPYRIFLLFLSRLPFRFYHVVIEQQPFHLLPSPVHPIGFSFCFFLGFLAIFILLSSNNNNIDLELLLQIVVATAIARMKVAGGNYSL